MLEEIERWCRDASLGYTVDQPGEPGFRASVLLDDPPDLLVIEVQGPDKAGEPLRLRHAFDLPAADGPQLTRERTAELLEAAVLQRSALVDAKLQGDAVPPTVEMVAVIHEDGLSRHTFMTALFECQKLRRILIREVRSALVSEAAMASLVALADASDGVTSAVDDALSKAPPGTVDGS